jgi:hypothetical protein
MKNPVEVIVIIKNSEGLITMGPFNIVEDDVEQIEDLLEGLSI